MDQRQQDSVVEILAVAAAAGMAALIVRHETGPAPFLKSNKFLRNVTIGVGIVAIGALTKSLSDYSKKGRMTHIFGIIAGTLAIAGLLVHAKRNEPKYMTSGGPDVFKAQLGLLKLGYPVSPTGHMDGPTTEALKRFQATNSLIAQDGSLTQETAAYIDMAVSQMHQPHPFTPDEGYHQPLITQT